MAIEFDEDDFRVTGNHCVNQVCIMTTEEGRPVRRILEGLQILKSEAKQTYKLATHPLEDGQLTVDTKIKNPTTITITGMCDNLRGNMNYPKEKEKAKNLWDSIGQAAESAYETLWAGKEFEASVEIKTFAMEVFAELHKMLSEKEFKMYSISTKGAVYNGMMLVDILQLNEPEHLLTIPVTLVFQEAIVDHESVEVEEAQEDMTIKMGGNVKEKGLLPALADSISDSLSGAYNFIAGE